MMNSDDDDMFISDEENIQSPPTEIVQLNPVQQYLSKQIVDVQNKIDSTKNMITELKACTAHILNALSWRELLGEDYNSDSDSDLYTVEGESVSKKQRFSNKSSNIEKKLMIVSQWQCILQNKWIIGVELQNKSYCTLLNPRYYPYVPDEKEICGESMFWKLRGDRFFHWEKTNSIHPEAVHVVAAMVLDLPKFDQGPVVECWSTISYKINEVQYQLPVPSVQLTITETIDSSCMKFLDENVHNAILALKSTCSTERIVDVRFTKGDRDKNESREKQLFYFLEVNAFVKICENIFMVKEHGSLMYCLIEVHSIDFDEARIKIFVRSVNQLNIIFHLLWDNFLKNNVTVEEGTDVCYEAANALINELMMIREKQSALKIQEAKIITDLLIP